MTDRTAPEEPDADSPASDDEFHDSEMASGDLASRLDRIAMGDRLADATVEDAEDRPGAASAP